MEKIRSINPGRIEWCCADFGITPGELATALAIAPASIERVIEGKDGLTFGQLNKLAKYFGRGVLFFLESGPVNEDHVHTAAFRTLANQKPELSAKTKALIERVERQRMVYMGLREELDDPGLPIFTPPVLPEGNLDRIACFVRDWLRLSANNDFDSYRAAVEARGILVFQSNGYNGKWQISKENPILGFTLYDEKYPVIVVKKQEWKPQQSFTLLHELGHLLLHKASSIDDEEDMNSHRGDERLANAFAGHVLVPDAFLANINDAERPNEVGQFDEWLAPYRKNWGVSGEVILRRLLDSERISQLDYRAYRAWKAKLVIPQVESGGSRAYRNREPKHIFGDVFVRTVLDALNAKRITLSKASRYLDGLKLSDLHALERHYARL